MIAAIMLAIVLHAQTALPVLGSTQSTSGANAVKFQPLVLVVGQALPLHTGQALVIH